MSEEESLPLDLEEDERIITNEKMAGQGQSQASEALKQFVKKDTRGKQILEVPEGKYKGWVPRSVYSMHLEQINLPFLRLQSFPVGGTSLGNLTGMRTFEAVGNYLHKLPNSFGNCKSLELLNVSFNHFEQLSPAVFKLTNLRQLNCSENELVTLSSDIGQLKHLQVLNLSGNMFSEIPDEIQNCKDLEHLDLSHKWYPRKGGLIELPRAACNLSKLKSLDVSWHEIHTIPDEVGNLTSLQYLNMKGNFLKYVSENIAMCTKLQVLDLTGAMKLNSVIPDNLFSLSELKVLNISGNYFTELPPAILGLSKIQSIIMRRNALLRMPDELFELKYLETLELSDNYLDNIPAGIRKLKKIKYIDLNGNKLKELPPEICKCYSLEQLSISGNELEIVPENLYRLTNLRELNLEHNQLKELPMMLDKMENLARTGRLSVYNNYLVKPPQEICNLGVEALFKYLRELRISEAKHRRKMILIGSAKAGKTSLRNALVLGHSKMTAEHERTWVLERHLWEPEPKIRVQILDFGGHHIYSAAHHMFLTPEALHVVVFDLTKYTTKEYETYVGDWIDAIADRAPGAHIVVVGTHSDLCPDQDHVDAICQDVLEKMHASENAKVADLKISLERTITDLNNLTGHDASTKFEDIDAQRKRDKMKCLQRLLNMRVKLPNKIDVVSCAEELYGVEQCRLNLQKILVETDEKPLPKSWYNYLMAIQVRKDKKILHWEQALHIFNDVMNSMNKSMISLEGSPETSLEMVLRYLHSTGEIVWYHDNPKLKGIIFHRPETLVEMLRAIFRHDFEKVVQFQERFGLLSGLSQHKFEEMKEDFLEQGLMTQELLQYCLLHFNLTTDARDMFIDLMLKFDLCYEVPKLPGAPMTFSSSRILKFPWFLKSDLPPTVATEWPDTIPVNMIPISFVLQFVRKLPPNFFEKLSARLQSHILGREDWKNGILGSRNRTKLFVSREMNGGIVDVSVSVRGSDLQELWQLILNCYKDIVTLLQEWPFARYEQWLLCSHCLLKGEEDPYKFPGEVLQTMCPKGVFEFQACKREKDKRIPACFLCPLDPEFQEDIAEHIKVVKEFLFTLYDTVDGAGLLSDLGLSYVAARLGVEWSLVALELGLTQPEIEQIQLDNPYQTVKQISTALIRWRDRQHNKGEMDILRQLIEAIQNADRQDLADDLEEKYHIEW